MSSAADHLFHSNGLINRELFIEELHGPLNAAARIAAETGWDNLRTPHLFMGIISEPDHTVCTWAKLVGIPKLDELLHQFESMFRLNVGPYLTSLQLHREFCSDNFITLLRRSLLRALQNGRAKVRSLDVLAEIFESPNSIVAECFRRTGVETKDLLQFVNQAESILSRPAE